MGESTMTDVVTLLRPRFRRRNSTQITFADLDNMVRTDVNLVGLMTDEELFNGVSAMRAKKPVLGPKIWWPRSVGTAMDYSNSEPTAPSWIDFRFLANEPGRVKDSDLKGA